MPKVVVHETITKEIEIPLETMSQVIDTLPVEEKRVLLDRLLASLEREEVTLLPFRNDHREAILADFRGTGLYEEEFLRDLEEGLKHSSVYR